MAFTSHQLKVLACIRILGEDAYGKAIHRELSANRKSPIKTANVYGVLRELVRKNLAVGRKVRQPGKQGHPRIVYILTREGAAVLEENSRIFARAGAQPKGDVIAGGGTR